MYYRARYYQPGLGRFASHDPESGRIRSPSTLNGYPYALANPLRWLDPYGRFVVVGAILFTLGLAFLVASVGLIIPYVVFRLTGETEKAREVALAGEILATIALGEFLLIWAIEVVAFLIATVTELGPLGALRFLTYTLANTRFIGPSEAKDRLFGIVVRGVGSIQLHPPHEAPPNDYLHWQVGIKGMEDTRYAFLEFAQAAKRFFDALLRAANK